MHHLYIFWYYHS